MKFNNISIEPVSSRAGSIIVKGIRMPKGTLVGEAKFFRNDYNNNKFEFVIVIDNTVYPIVADDYKPVYVFATPENNTQILWKPSKVTKLKSISEHYPYWTYLYDGMPVKGLVIDSKFVLNLEHLEKVCDKYYISWIKKRNKELKNKL